MNSLFASLVLISGFDGEDSGKEIKAKSRSKRVHSAGGGFNGILFDLLFFGLKKAERELAGSRSGILLVPIDEAPAFREELLVCLEFVRSIRVNIAFNRFEVVVLF